MPAAHATETRQRVILRPATDDSFLDKSLPPKASSTPEPSPALSIEHELRLRRWAREYYVAPEARSDAWHDVILQEMELKDYEESIERPREVTRYVPLEPTLERRFDQKHEMRGPHFMRPAIKQRTEERLYADVVPGEMYYT